MDGRNIGILEQVSRIYCPGSQSLLTSTNSIIFGEKEEEDEAPKINRGDRIRQIEAQQREKEGLLPVGLNSAGSPTPPAMTPPRRQRIPEPNNPGEFSRFSLEIPRPILLLSSTKATHTRRYIERR